MHEQGAALLYLNVHYVLRFKHYFYTTLHICIYKKWEKNHMQLFTHHKYECRHCLKKYLNMAIEDQFKVVKGKLNYDCKLQIDNRSF